MKQKKSCGIIPFLIKDNELYVLLVKQHNDVINFPKGHVENNETEEQTALRECLEETNLVPILVDGFKEEISYYMSEYDANKMVILFIEMINNSDTKKQESEIENIYICKIEKALDMISFDDTKNLLNKAVAYLKQQ